MCKKCSDFRVIYRASCRLFMNRKLAKFRNLKEVFFLPLITRGFVVLRLRVIDKCVDFSEQMFQNDLLK